MQVTPNRGVARTLPSLVIALLAASQAQAQTERTWTGVTSANFGTATNWSNSTAPGLSNGTLSTALTYASTDVAVFNGTAQAGALTLGSHRSLGGIQFRGSAVASYSIGDTSASAYRFLFTLGGETSMDADVANPQTLQRVGLNGPSGGSYTFRNDATSSSASFNFASSLISYSTSATNLVLTGTNAGPNQIVGAISQNSGAGALSITKNGAGTWVLQGSNTFTGGVTVNAGTLALRNDTALGTGTLTLAGGRVGSVVSGRTIANAISITGNVGLGGAATGSLSGVLTTFTGAVSLNGGTRTLSLGNSAVFSNVISSGGLVVEATSASLGLTLNGANTYAGGTVVNSGRLITGNASALGTGSLTISGGDLRIADSAASSVTLGAGANFAMTSGSWTLQLGNSFDQLVGNGGTFSFGGGTLNLDITGTGFDFGSSYQILSSFSGGSVSSLGFLALNGGAEAVTFESLGYVASLSDSGLLSFSASSVPEPSAAAVFAGIGVLALGMTRRRRS